MTDDVLTPEDLMALLKIDAVALQKTLQNGDMPGRYVGGHWRFSRDAVLRWLGELSVQDAIHLGREATIRRQDPEPDDAELPDAPPPSAFKRVTPARPAEPPKPTFNAKNQAAVRNFNTLSTMQKGDLLASVE